ncbi:ABC transporter substrate-binding protein [Aureimonas altamirensis]|uniref:ABC transporter substrate-binding protein n=1 Tax=Aureimonas TaxID=414371 RepID=UPI001786B337|nr:MULTISPECIES: ABC transporter substrate-binding protein [Aureimonas]MCM2504233.1 ABC transporter substrate-binding protein [Aureimonas altamirensis]QOG05152.1 ABC transporter substrate-binding protein [Aureimonas sp. OT7]
MRRREFLTGTASGALLVATGGWSWAQDAAAPTLGDIPRERTIIIQNPESAIRNPGWFNIWVNAGGGIMNGLQQLAMDTLWYIDPDAGIEGQIDDGIYHSLAAGPWEYSDDFKRMTVRLRDNLLWSDGTPFTADDVVYTVTKQIETPGMIWSSTFSTQVDSVTAQDPATVVFELKEPNSRFHAIFSVRWGACWIMPKHVFEGVDDVLNFPFNPPVSIGAYTLDSFDPNGTWFIWNKRSDWDRTSLGVVGEPAPERAIYRNNISIDNRLIEMRNGNLDMIHDLTPEGAFSIIQQDPQTQGWFKGFPYAHPDPTLIHAMFNQQGMPIFQDKRVRWALALMLDARAMSMASYRGAATLSAIAVPPTGTHPRDYHEPLQQYLMDYELDLGARKIKPYDAAVPLQIADMVRGQFGDGVPSDEAEVRRAFGYGWWKQDIEAATELLTAAGLTQSGRQWLLPDGQPFRFSLMMPTDGVVNRLGSLMAQLWSQQGIQVTPEPAPDVRERLTAGDYVACVRWAVETYGGHPDLSFFLDSYHSDFVSQRGTAQPPRNLMRYSTPRQDEIIEEIRRIDFSDPRTLELGHEFVKYYIDEMPIIPIMAYNVFAIQSNRYWTGWPSADQPYANPVTNWGNSRYVLTQIRPAG